MYLLKLTDGINDVDFLVKEYLLENAGFEIRAPKKKQLWGGGTIFSHGESLVSSKYENRRLRITFEITGATRDEFNSNASDLERLLTIARRRAIEQQGNRVELQYQIDGASMITYFEIIDGTLTFPRDIMSVEQVLQTDLAGRFVVHRFVLDLIAHPFGFSISPVNGSPVAVPLSNGNGTDVTGGLKIVNHDDSHSGDDNWVEIKAVDIADSEQKLDTILQLKQTVTVSGRTQKFYIGHRTGNTDFTHILEDKNAAIIRTTDSVDIAAAIADDGGVLTDETAEANDPTSNDMTLLPVTPVVNDAYYFGHTGKYISIILFLTTVGAGSWTITWEYWNGGSWATLPGINDPSNGFRTAISATDPITHDFPTDWTTTTVNSQGPFYYTRARVSAFSSITIQPLGGGVDRGKSLGSENASGGSYSPSVISDTDAVSQILYQWNLTAEQAAKTQGPFRIFGKVRQGFSWNENASYQVRLTLSSLIRLAVGKVVKPITSNVELLDFGTFHLPPGFPSPALNPSDEDILPYEIAIYATYDEGVGTAVINLDYLMLLPLDGGYRVIQFPVLGLFDDHFVVDDGWEDQVYFMDEAPEFYKLSYPIGLLSRIRLLPNQKQRLYIVQESDTKNVEINRELEVELFKIPRFTGLI